MTETQLESTFESFVNLLESLHAPAPFDTDLCEDSVVTLLELHRRLKRAGIEFPQDFERDMKTLGRICTLEFEPDSGIEDFPHL